MKFLNMIERFNIAVGKAVSFLIWAGIVVLCYEVVARYVFNAPTIWAHGYTQRIFGAYFVMIGAYTLVRGSHVRVDLLTKTRWPRFNACLDLLNCIFLLIWGGVLIWEGWWFFEDAWAFGELDDSVLRHPMWPIKLSLFAGALLITAQGLVEAARSIILIINPNADVGRATPDLLGGA
ncbi:TRAP transporter small permease subunit [Profundibacterium mesophilum]|uniref:TRAP transporter small permease protein n=1 Tax=Profundibacterium mesophilum KAUST100406-0324 TaxID=1037889 RepID=A0A921NRB9_9RHOB|nr:TRAP transporter small permease subunit [Profundibacterium mesophilum]KAF0677197.1 Tripartite ATP-independent periplasmic transporter DctQ component [Profundibacterium mesophilum KAUST100406-0324]